MSWKSKTVKALANLFSQTLMIMSQASDQQLQPLKVYSSAGIYEFRLIGADNLATVNIPGGNVAFGVNFSRRAKYAIYILTFNPHQAQFDGSHMPESQGFHGLGIRLPQQSGNNASEFRLHAKVERDTLSNGDQLIDLCGGALAQLLHLRHIGDRGDGIADTAAAIPMECKMEYLDEQGKMV